MTNAPERIWATVNGMRSKVPGGPTWKIGGWEDRGPQSARHVEYVRADTIAWRPIETAPNDESILVAYEDGSINLVDAADNDYDWRPVIGERGNGLCRPTHWMPLPAPPKGGA